MGVGNGGWSGAIVYQALVFAVLHNYAAASTNTGHDGGDASFAPGHPEKLGDFAYRAAHEMTVKAKEMAKAHYGKGPPRADSTACPSRRHQRVNDDHNFPRHSR